MLKNARICCSTAVHIQLVAYVSCAIRLSQVAISLFSLVAALVEQLVSRTIRT